MDNSISILPTEKDKHYPSIPYENDINKLRDNFDELIKLGDEIYDFAENKIDNMNRTIFLAQDVYNVIEIASIMTIFQETKSQTIFLMLLLMATLGYLADKFSIISEQANQLYEFNDIHELISWLKELQNKLNVEHVHSFGKYEQESVY